MGIFDFAFDCNVIFKFWDNFGLSDLQKSPTSVYWGSVLEPTRTVACYNLMIAVAAFFFCTHRVTSVGKEKK